MLSPKIEEQLQKVKWLCDKGGVDCVGYMAVYRVEFGAVMFFLLMALIMLGVKSSRDPRSSIQNGFWGLKFLILIGIIVGAFYIPTKDGKFIQAWMYVGLIGGFLFIIIQLILLIDFVHRWNEVWVENMEETDNRGWFFALAFFTLVMYAVSLAGIVCMFVYFTRSDHQSCHTEKFIVSFQLILSVLVSVLAISPAVQERLPKSGLLQASAISLYTTYLGWSAFSYSTSDCNSIRKTIAGLTNEKPDVDAQSIIGVVITFILVIFSSIRTSANSQVGRLGGDRANLGEPSDQTPNVTVVDDGGSNGQTVYDDEDDGVTYSYTFYHVMMMLASLYLMMTITNWYKPSGSNFNKLSASQASFWIKISSSWVCMALYAWTLLAPVVFPDRDFD